MATAGQWVEAARPRTLPAAIAPVLAGTGAAAAAGGFVAVRALLALVVALALQVAVNFANDYSDGVRGTDADRVGPFRLVGSGAAAPRVVKAAAFVTFGVAAVAGLVVVALAGQWWLLLPGAAAILAAWYYTGGRRPYGYIGLGEVSVFVFFGLVAVIGTGYVQAGQFTLAELLGGVGCGALSSAILVANNLRDVPTDAQTGKRTLAVRLGDSRTRALYLALLVLAALSVVGIAALSTPWALLALVAAPLAVPPVRAIRAGVVGRALIAVLGSTGRLTLAYGALLGLGLALAS